MDIKLQGYILPFAILHAVEAGHQQLKPRDLLAGMFVYSPDRFLERSKFKAPQDIGKLFGFEEPLWIIQTRYLMQIHAGDAAGPQVAVSSNIQTLLEREELEGATDPFPLLLAELFRLDPEIAALYS